MKNLYKLDKLSVFGIFLISFFMTVIQMIVSDPDIGNMPQMGKWLKLVIFAVGTLVAFLIGYWLFSLLLRNNSNYKTALIINMAIGLTIVALLEVIIHLIAGKSNIWVNGVAGFLGFGTLAGLNWKFLAVPQSDKIKISVLTGIWFILSLF